MKKRFLILSMIIVLISLMIYSCGVAKGTSTYNNSTVCSNYNGEPMSSLPVGLIHDMVQGYKFNQLDEINSSMAMRDGDTRALWFDLETLKKFIYHIEAKTKDQNNSIRTEDLGVRIYYASYPKQDNWDLNRYGNTLSSFGGPTQRVKYEKRHTVIMVPTILRDSVNMDFNPLDDRTYTQRLQDVGNAYDKNSEVPMLGIGLMNRSGGGSFGSQNHGSMYPPEDESGLGF